MTDKEAVEIFQEIVTAYHNMEVTKEKFNFWMDHLKTMDYEQVRYRLKQHIYSSPFPPTISQIQSRIIPENTFLKKIEERKRLLDARNNE